jgi:hypothetical protein
VMVSMLVSSAVDRGFIYGVMGTHDLWHSRGAY